MDFNKPLGEQASSIQTGVSDAISGATNKISSGLSSLTSNADLGSASSEFINSNSIISKFVFLILVLIVFVMIAKIYLFPIYYNHFLKNIVFSTFTGLVCICNISVM